jgi:hypothetical protein
VLRNRGAFLIPVCGSGTDFLESENETFQGEKEEHQVLENITISAFLVPDPARNPDSYTQQQGVHWFKEGYSPFPPQEVG